MRVNFKQGSDSWHLWRNAGIGGTDAAAIMGVSGWDTALSIYAVKTRPPSTKAEHSPYQEWGSRIEPLLVDKFLEEEIHDIYMPVVHGPCYIHDDFHWAKASIDAVVSVVGPNDSIRRDCIIECKTSRDSLKWNPVPEGYYAQIQWQMFVSGIREAHFSVLAGGYDWFTRKVEYEETYVNNMFAKCKKFYDDWQAGIPPVVGQPLEAQYNALVDMSAGEEPRRRLELYKGDFLRYMALKKNLDEAQLAYDKMKHDLLAKMSGGYDLYCDDICVAKRIERKGTDTLNKKMLKQQYPDVYNKVVNQSGIISYIKFC